MHTKKVANIHIFSFDLSIYNLDFQKNRKRKRANRHGETQWDRQEAEMERQTEKREGGEKEADENIMVRVRETKREIERWSEKGR